MDIDINRKEFTNWVRSLAPEATCGLARSATACPIANWMYVRYGEFFLVSNSVVMRKSTIKYYHVPAWAERFITKIDGMGNHAVVKVSDALKILGTI